MFLKEVFSFKVLVTLMSLMLLKEAAAENMATAWIHPEPGQSVGGKLELSSKDGAVRISGVISGLKPMTTYQLHIHSKEDCVDTAAYNGDQKTKSKLGTGNNERVVASVQDAQITTIHHVGELSEVKSNINGEITLYGEYSYFSLNKSMVNSILDKAIIIHKGEDEMVSQNKSHGEGKLACGIING